MASKWAQISDEILGSIHRTKREEVRITLRKSEGKTWLDLRCYFQSETGSMVPTARGISLSGRELTQLRQILDKLYGDPKGGGHGAS